MSVDYGLTNTTRYYSVPDDADFTLPNADWAWMVQCRIEPDAVNPRYIIATNGYGNAASFNLVVNSSPFRLLAKYNATADLLTASSPPESVPVWLYATRRSGVFYAGFCPVGSSTVVEATGTNIAGTTSDGTALRLGGNSTATTNRMWMGGWTQYALSSGQGVTAAQIAELAMGAPLLAMPFAPSIVFALHGKTASATIADLIKGKVATKVGASYGTNEEDFQTPYVWAESYSRGITSSSGSTGTLAYTNAADTLAASGSATVTGSLSTTNANDTLAASGKLTVSGSLNATNANDTLVASGALIVSGSSNTTNADDTLAASGASVSSSNGALNYTNANDTLAASGKLTVIGSASVSSVNDSLTASGVLTVVGSLATTNANDVLTASGASGSITGTLAYTNANDRLVAAGISGNEVSREGGDDFPVRVIYKTRKKTLREQPNKHLESILDKATKEVLGVKNEELPRTSEPLPRKVIILKKVELPRTPKPDIGITISEQNQEVAKVTALLAEYEAQALAHMQEDEELIMLIVETF